MKLTTQHRLALSGIAVVIVVLALAGINRGSAEHTTEKAPSPPVLSVALTKVEEVMLPHRVPATGNVVAWQEAIVSAESDGLKLVEVNVNVGDTVTRGQVLARFNADIAEAELAEAVASVAQAEAAMMEAELNFSRTKTLAITNAISAQQLDQNKIAAMTARARLEAARAIEKKNRLLLTQANVVAPNDGVMTARSATVGTVVPSAQELFRLIEDGRLEWRAVVAAADMEKLLPGQNVVINAQQQIIKGTLRTLAPTIDTSTHNGLVYVDLPINNTLRAGTFARGYIEVSSGLTLTLPQRAVILRDGFHYVMQVKSDSTVALKKINVGRQIDDRIEIISGLAKSEAVIESGLGFLSEGDKVKIVNPLPTSSTESPPLFEGRVREGFAPNNIEGQQ